MISGFIRFRKALIESRGNCAFLEDVLNRMQVFANVLSQLVCQKAVTLSLAQERECGKPCPSFAVCALTWLTVTDVSLRVNKSF